MASTEKEIRRVLHEIARYSTEVFKLDNGEYEVVCRNAHTSEVEEILVPKTSVYWVAVDEYYSNGY